MSWIEPKIPSLFVFLIMMEDKVWGNGEDKLKNISCKFGKKPNFRNDIKKGSEVWGATGLRNKLGV